MKTKREGAPHKEKKTEIVLDVKNISKSYKDRKILDNISFEIKKGEILGIVGYSGSGKTTLINIICGLISPDDGKVYHFFNDENKEEEALVHFNARLKECIGISTQISSFYQELTVFENLVYFSKLFDIKKPERNNNIDRILGLLNMQDAKDLKADHLSGGMKKRLDIACTLISSPKILILDEPTDSLDFTLRRDFLEIIKKINKTGVSIIFVSHILEEIEFISDRVGFLNDKTLEITDSTEHIKRLFKSGGCKNV